MSTKDFTANVISASKVVPDGNFKDSKASGIWDINEALDLIKGGNWPNVANINPAAFVDGVFQTHLYDGTGANQTITNNINLSGSGGLVWLKSRDGSTSAFHTIYDTERGTGPDGGRIFAGTASTNAASTQADGLQSFNSDGFTLGANLFENGTNSAYGTKYCSWTFRQQPKFFDVVTYEGTGSARTVAHSLNTTVGMILIKNLDQTDNWAVYHRANTAAPQTDYLILNTTAATADSADWWNDTAPTTSVFTVGTDHSVNASGENYVAYLFAHNNDDGGFGEPGDQDIIKCGSVSTDGSGDATVDLGFEPQWLMVKATNQNYNWEIYDQMRGFGVTGHKILIPNLSNAEGTNTNAGNTQPTSTGFSIGGGYWGNNVDLIYMAIRRGGMQTPTAASSVFSIVQNTNTLIDDTKVDFGITPDMHIANRTTSGMSHFITARLTGGKYMFTNSNSAEDSTPLSSFNEEQTTVEYTGQAANDSGTYNHIGWKRARGYFDIVTYTGNGTAGRTVNHNLGVAPEMMWIKQRDGAGDFAAPCDYTDTTFRRLQLSSNGGSAAVDYTSITSDGSNPLHNKPTATQIILNSAANVNQNTKTYIAFLFATAPGVSKVGTVTHSGSSTDVDCGFTSGASLVIMKRVDDTGSWLLFDSVRGIIAGNSPYLKLQAATAEVTSVNILNPLSSGFQIPDDQTDGDYIFYAIAAIS